MKKRRSGRRCDGIVQLCLILNLLCKEHVVLVDELVAKKYLMCFWVIVRVRLLAIFQQDINIERKD